MRLLHDITSARNSINGSQPKIMFSTLQGAEFGAPKAFEDDNSWMYASSEERHEFFAKMEKHSHPDLLKEVEQWVVRGQIDEVNPLLRFGVPRD